MAARAAPGRDGDQAIDPPTLPVHLTSFVGREEECAAVGALLRSVRLVTLTGPGGVGKTRLALAVAAAPPAHGADGAHFVDLSHLRDPALVPQAIAAALGLRDSADRSVLDAAASALGAAPSLLILDNCEHVISGAAALTDALLRACPPLRVLATSREPLGVPGETVWTVPPLAHPDLTRLPVRDHLSRLPSVRLFVERAGLARPGFALANDNAAAVAQICARLDGLPLAIELAAARLRAFDVAEIAAHLEDSLALLTGGGRTVAPRQQTLEATISWSYDLLEPAEQTFFQGLSVFAGGFTLHTAASVTRHPALEYLPRLVEKSLVVAESRERTGAAGREPRYRLLETLRQFAHARLAAAGRLDETRRRHAETFTALAERADAVLTYSGTEGGDQRVWLRRLDAEHDNLRAALTWASEARDAPLALRLAGALANFWFLRGTWTEGLDHLSRALALQGHDAPAAVRAKALRGAGLLAAQLDQYAAARERYQRALALSREASDVTSESAALTGLAEVACYQVLLSEARQHGEAAVALSRDVGAPWPLAQALNTLGVVGLYSNDLALAERCHTEALALRRALDDRRGLAWSLLHLGLLAHQRGDLNRCFALFGESLAIRRELGDKQGIAYTLEDWAQAALDAGQTAHARALAEESAALFHEIGDRWGQAIATDALAAVAAREGRHAEARRLAADAEARRAAIGVPLSAPWRKRRERHLPTGLAARGIAERRGAPAWASRSARDAGLSAREWEVLALLVEGATNPEIASRLVISRHTVVRHVSNILAKLAAATRAEAVARALGRHSETSASAAAVLVAPQDHTGRG